MSVDSDSSPVDSDSSALDGLRLGLSGLDFITGVHITLPVFSRIIIYCADELTNGSYSPLRGAVVVFL